MGKKSRVRGGCWGLAERERQRVWWREKTIKKKNERRVFRIER